MFSAGRKGAIPHTVEDIPDMRSALGGVGETTIRGGILGEAIDTSWPPWDLGPSHLLDGSNTSKGPQVTVADPRELDLDLLQQNSSYIQAVVGTVDRLGFKAHGSIVAVHFTISLELSHGRIRSVFTSHQYQFPYRMFPTHAKQGEEAPDRRNRRRIPHR